MPNRVERSERHPSPETRSPLRPVGRERAFVASQRLLLAGLPRPTKEQAGEEGQLNTGVRHDGISIGGTAAEVTPLRSVDDHELGVGPITLHLQAAYLDVVHGRGALRAGWLDPVPAGAAA